MGIKTPGYFTVGQFLFADQPKDYVLYLCKNLLTLDGKVIEGIGISPNIKVSFSPTGRCLDTQLSAGVSELVKTLR